MNKYNRIRVLSACVTGPSHKVRNIPCQDYCRYATKGDNFVAILSDGAGSAKYGRIGAKILCDTYHSFTHKRVIFLAVHLIFATALMFVGQIPIQLLFA